MSKKNIRPPKPPTPDLSRYSRPPAFTQSAALQSVDIHHYQGPLPDPATLRNYNETLPGLADRIVVMAEKEQDARHDLERRAMSLQHSDILQGRICAVLVVAMFLGTSATLVFTGHDVAGASIGGTTLVGVVYTLVTGRRINRRETSAPPDVVKAAS